MLWIIGKRTMYLLLMLLQLRCDLRYAKSHGFHIKTGPGTENFLQFADGSYQETVGQVTTHWTFASGERALLTFEVLEACASEVVIGEDFIYSHKIFHEYEASLWMFSLDNDSFDLAPFDFVTTWQKNYLNMKSKLQFRRSPGMSSFSHVLKLLQVLTISTR